MASAALATRCVNAPEPATTEGSPAEPRAAEVTHVSAATGGAVETPEATSAAEAVEAATAAEAVEAAAPAEAVEAAAAEASTAEATEGGAVQARANDHGHDRQERPSRPDDPPKASRRHFTFPPVAWLSRFAAVLRKEIFSALGGSCGLNSASGGRVARSQSESTALN